MIPATWEAIGRRIYVVRGLYMGPHMVGRERANSNFHSLRTLEKVPLLTSSQSNYLPKSSSSNTITLGVTASTNKLQGATL
jgi:hypothetical protein